MKLYFPVFVSRDRDQRAAGRRRACAFTAAIRQPRCTVKAIADCGTLRPAELVSSTRH